MDDMTEWDDRRSAGTAPGPAWVSAADAADKAGITPGRVREWASAGLIASQPTKGPLGEQVLVRLDEVVDFARGEGPPLPEGAEPPRVYNHVSTAELSPIFKTIPELVAQLTSATDRAARAETKVEFLTRQVSELKRKLALAADAGVAVPDVQDEIEQEIAERVEEPVGEAFAEAPPAPPEDSPASVSDEPEGDAGLPAEPEVPVDEPRDVSGADALSSIWAEDAAPAGPGSSGESRRLRRLPDPPRRRRWWSRRR
jgi:hypothetical protein